MTTTLRLTIDGRSYVATRRGDRWMAACGAIAAWGDTAHIAIANCRAKVPA